MSGLENVLDPRDAMYVNLKERPNIEDLTMVWSEDSGNSRNESTEIEVLKWLQPHQSLKKLEIAFYGGSKFPHWIGDPSFSKMVCLELTDCKNCTSLPALGGLPFLKDLVIEGMNQVKSIEWNNWLIPKLGHEETQTLFPCLRELTIRRCPKLINLPHELPSLVVFLVEECQELEMSIPQLPLLTKLKLSCLWERLAQRLMVLEDLAITECDELACLRKPGFGLENLGGLRRLWINGCDGVVSLEEQGLPYNLQYLEVNGCSNLEKLPNALHTLTSLAYMIIDNCPKLVSFPETVVPLSTWKLKIVHLLLAFRKGATCHLKNLIIENCEKLESLPEGIDNNNTCRLEKLHQLESIPGNMLQNLTSLQFLHISNCPDVVSSPEAFLNPNLKQLCISNYGNMRWPLSGWGLRTLTSLDELVINGPFPDLLSFSCSHLLLPTSLTSLGLVNLHNLKSVTSMGLRSLMSLKSLNSTVALSSGLLCQRKGYHQHLQDL
ncbi:putative disease resistance RPP13-like protein 1 [Vitis vinifera]|uniref:Putative disease resistance RPP13-like protein 1 n=1 Tax=Vitis vinifera TaxID=29760 RepID=A0A438I7W0_VITVI|nr:putative disease resistance RPP13-like protein 1 [Vitis vinifera]